MRLKEDNNLAYIAKCANRPIAELSHDIAQSLLEHGLIRDDKEDYGQHLRDCIKGDAPAIDVVIVLMKATGIEQIMCDMFDAFCGCILMGDGDCPECGGKMEIYDCEGHEIPSCSQYEEPVWEIYFERVHCPVCGHETINDYR